MSLNIGMNRLFDQDENSIVFKNENLQKDENDLEKCPHYFGYLNIHIRYSTLIPDICLICSKATDCTLFSSENVNSHPYLKLEKTKEKKLKVLTPIQ